MLRAPGDDSLRQGRSDPRQPCDLAHVGAVHIDALTGKERTRELSGAARSLTQGGAAGGRGGLKLNVAGRRIGRGRKEEADAGAG